MTTFKMSNNKVSESYRFRCNCWRLRGLFLYADGIRNDISADGNQELTLNAMKTPKYISLIALAALVGGTALIGCDSTGPKKSAAAAATVATISNSGTVVFRDKDGGFYGILTDNGGQYEPKNLSARYCSDGLRISFSGQLDTAQLGEHQWGNPVEIAVVNEAR